jgi:hypothetical protein
MNTGIGDAVNLAWKLTAVLQGHAHERILDSYEIERIPFARKLVDTTDRVFSLVTTRSSRATLVRLHLVPLLVPILFRFQSLKRAMFRTLSQIAIKYPQSFLSAGQAGRIKKVATVYPGNTSPCQSFSFGNFEPLRDKQWQIHCYGKISEKLNNFSDKRFRFIFWSGLLLQKTGYLENAVYVVRPDAMSDWLMSRQILSVCLIIRINIFSKIILHPWKCITTPTSSTKRKTSGSISSEFLMIFLAVTLGFIAENLREHISDSNKEKEYIVSMVEDLKGDTAKPTSQSRELHARYMVWNTLEMLLNPDVNANDSAVFICYRQGESLFDEHTINFSTRTITQLPNREHAVI